MKSKVEQAEIYIKSFYAGTLGDNLLKALSMKWFRLNTIYFIKDKNGKKVRFRPNEAQLDFYINAHGNDLILKARQLGFTTFKMIYDLDDCLFIPNHSAGCIAHNDKAAKEIFRNKIKFAYENIGHSMKALLSMISSGLPLPTSDRDGMYSFDNGSTLSVSTGFRGGTLQSLHVSEMGKICKKRPDIAEEIVTGAFESVPITGTKTIESTAEGAEGKFYDYCSAAETRQKQGKKTSKAQFYLHFYAWFKDSLYTSDEEVEVPQRIVSYFDKLSNEIGYKFTQGQINWYCAKDETLGDKCRQEYPSTPEEAFRNSIEGAYYAVQFTKIYKEGRIDFDNTKMLGNESVKVHTAWDIGIGDYCSIWFYRIIGNQIHIIDYYQNCGEGLRHYAKMLKEYAEDFGYVYGNHYAPHDINNREYGNDAISRKDTAYNGWELDGEHYNIDFHDLDRTLSVEDDREQVRTILDSCYFAGKLSQKSVTIGERSVSPLDILESYHKKWDAKKGRYSDKHDHDWACDGADAFRYFAVAETKVNNFIGLSDTLGF